MNLEFLYQIQAYILSEPVLVYLFAFAVGAILITTYFQYKEEIEEWFRNLGDRW